MKIKRAHALRPVCHALMLSTLTLTTNAVASWESFIGDSTLETKAKVNIYDIKGAYDSEIFEIGNRPVKTSNEISMEEIGVSLWGNWQSGYLFDVLGVELGYLAAGPNLYNDGYTKAQFNIGAWPLGTMSNPYGRFYEGSTSDKLIGKLGNANAQLRVGDNDNFAKLSVGRFTPTVYNLLHRPDYIYGALHEVYEGAALTGELNWSWGMVQPWFNYFTGFSNMHSTKTLRFKDDLIDGKDFGSFDEIYNIGYHSETDYFVSSASYSVAPDYQRNGIIELYTGIPLSYLAGDTSGDTSKILKFLVKYGMEEGTGPLNSDHKTDVVEFGVGIDTGDFDMLVGVSKIGDESFRGFQTQNGYKAGGGTAVWGDLAVFNAFDLAGQSTFFVFGGYDLDNVGFQKWRIQGIAAMVTDTDRSKLNPMQKVLVAQEDYTEINLELSYNHLGEGLGYRILVGADTNMKGLGVGLFFEYNTDLLN